MAISDLLTPYLTYVKIAGVAALLIGASYLWLHHDKHEQTQGAQACVQATTTAGAEQTTRTNQTNVEAASVLAKAVATYDQKIRDLGADRDSLAQRLHDAEAARARSAGTVPNLAGTPGFVCRPADDGRPTDRDRREAANLEACAANTIELISIRQAWKDLAAAQQSYKTGKPP